MGCAIRRTLAGEGKVLVSARQHAEGLRVGDALGSKFAKQFVRARSVAATRDGQAPELPQAKIAGPNPQAVLHGVIREQRFALPQELFNDGDYRVCLRRRFRANHRC